MYIKSHVHRCYSLRDTIDDPHQTSINKPEKKVKLTEPTESHSLPTKENNTGTNIFI